MGLYDTFIAPHGTVCPNCKTPLEHFQTKGLGEGMGMFRLGDAVADLEGDLYIERGSIHCYTFCRECRWWIDAKAVVHDAKYSGFEMTSGEPPTKPAES
jgi:uncharacterized protein YbaR (Trm112 family)